MKKQQQLFIGLMSGTSMDGIDAVLVKFEQDLQVISAHYNQIPAPIKSQLQALCLPSHNEIYKMAKLDVIMADLFAETCVQLCEKAQVNPSEITAIGSHGQTIRHLPEVGNTLQIGDPNRIAYLTGIDTISDFRRKDMAASGQGAPLAPAFHQHLLSSSETNRIVVNIGGISNITILDINGSQPNGYDLGPGNALMDNWIQRHKHEPYDQDGKWAKSGKVIPSLLSKCISHPFLTLTPPKSTGKETFNLEWLDQVLADFPETFKAEDIQATLLEFTLMTIKSACDEIIQESEQWELILCGGGARNSYLVEKLSNTISLPVLISDDLGVDCDLMEAIAFAWFAHQRVNMNSTTLTHVTGAKENCILGGIYSFK